jgi:hypothetical protein
VNLKSGLQMAQTTGYKLILRGAVQSFGGQGCRKVKARKGLGVGNFDSWGGGTFFGWGYWLARPPVICTEGERFRGT